MTLPYDAENKAVLNPIPIYCIMGSYDHEGSTTLRMFFDKYYIQEHTAL